MVRDVAKRVAGRTLSNPKLHKTDVLRGVSKRRLLAALRGRRVDRVFRRAKHAVFALRGGQYVIIQPRMTGTLMVVTPPPTPTERRYVVLEASVGRRATFLFRDVRRLGTIALLDEEEWTAYSAGLGPEPLDTSFTSTAFAEVLGNSHTAIKKAVMDQRRVAGVGNIYANEALFRARIDPSRPAHRLQDEEIRRLHRAIRSILSRAIESRGTTVRDYRTGTGQRGGFQKRLQVYGRGGRPCRRCGTVLTTTHAIDGRATTFCWRCQT